MPNRGGNSTISGTDYQNWYLALKFSYLLFENNLNLYPEAKGMLPTGNEVIIDDLVTDNGEMLEYYSLKQNAPNTSHNWSFSALKKENVLLDFKKQLSVDSNSLVHFVSESPCYLFSEVLQRVRGLMTPFDEEIEDVLDSKKCISLWRELKEHLDYDALDMLRFSKCVQVSVLPLREIKKLIEHRLLMFCNEKSASDVLFTLASEKSRFKNKLDKMDVLERLGQKGIKIKKL